jgi:hypothetical protein
LNGGVQATAQAHGEFTIDRESEDGWSKLGLNVTSAVGSRGADADSGP